MRWSRNIQLAIVAACIIVAFVYGLTRISPNRDGRKLHEVQTVSSSLRVFPGFREVESSTHSGYTSASVTRRFRCVSNCATVNEFYSQMLEANGWSRSSLAIQPHGETLFRKKDLAISIFQSESSHVYDYAIDITWQFR
jgi:hypothetical protein